MIFGHLLDDNEMRIRLPNGRKKTVSGAARATIWVVAVGGRIDKPLLNAGWAFHTFKAKRYKCFFFFQKTQFPFFLQERNLMPVTNISKKPRPSRAPLFLDKGSVSSPPAELECSMVPSQSRNFKRREAWELVHHHSLDLSSLASLFFAFVFLYATRFFFLRMSDRALKRAHKDVGMDRLILLWTFCFLTKRDRDNFNSSGRC